MTLLHTLRNTPWLARVALLWFALTLGVAVASPMVKAQHDLIVCTSAGMVRVLLQADGSISTQPSSELSCPLCMVGGSAPPAVVSTQPAPVPVPARVQQGGASVVVAACTAAPPPSRAPPAPV